MPGKIYKERQRFLKSKKFRLILLSVSLLILAIIVRVVLNPELQISTSGLLLSASALTLLGLTIVSLRLMRIKLDIYEKGIKYQMIPFHRDKRFLPWSDITKIKVMETPSGASWQGQYHSYLLKEKITFTGRNGLSIRTRHGQTLFIGSSNTKKLAAALYKASNYFEN